MKKRKIIIVIVCLVTLWIAVGIVDCCRVHSFERPIFCIATETTDDGGSGKYIGLGYSFNIEGNFMPEDEFPGVTKWTYFLFGKNMGSGIRD